MKEEIGLSESSLIKIRNTWRDSKLTWLKKNLDDLGIAAENSDSVDLGGI